MASGNFTGSTNNQYIQPKITWTAAPDTDGNFSTVTATLTYSRTNTGYETYGTWEGWLTINGNKKTASKYLEIAYNSNTVAITHTVKVNHNADGSKNITISAGGGIPGTSFSSTSISKTVALDNIPRASSISGISGSTIGSPVTVTISREVAGFTHKVYYTLGNVKNRLLGSDVGTSLTFTPPMSDCSQITASTKGTATIRVDTYNGSTKIGSSSKNFTLNVPASVVPNFTGISFTRIDGDVPESWGVYVQSKSKVTAAITDAAGAYGSTIKSYSISGGGYSGTESSLTTGVLKEAGEITFTAKITDSRGRTATKTASITVVAYTAPTLSSITGFRCDAGGTEQDDGEFISLTANFSGASVNGYNTTTGRYRTRPEGGDWSDYSSLISGEAAVFAASGDFTFTVQVEVSDAFTSFAQEIIVNSIRFIMDFRKGGNGIAFGKSAEYDDLMDINWDIHARKGLVVDGEAQFPGGVVFPNAVPVTQGGTGATSAQQALSNLGAAPASHNHAASNITSGVISSARLPMAWKKVSVSFSNGYGSVACSGVTTSSTILAFRQAASGDTSGGYTDIAAVSCTSNGTVRLYKAATTNDAWTCHIWWSK